MSFFQSVIYSLFFFYSKLRKCPKVFGFMTSLWLNRERASHCILEKFLGIFSEGQKGNLNPVPCKITRNWTFKAELNKAIVSNTIKHIIAFCSLYIMFNPSVKTKVMLLHAFFSAEPCFASQFWASTENKLLVQFPSVSSRLQCGGKNLWVHKTSDTQLKKKNKKKACGQETKVLPVMFHGPLNPTNKAVETLAKPCCCCWVWSTQRCPARTQCLSWWAGSGRPRRSASDRRHTWSTPDGKPCPARASSFRRL